MLLLLGDTDRHHARPVQGNVHVTDNKPINQHNQLKAHNPVACIEVALRHKHAPPPTGKQT